MHGAKITRPFSAERGKLPTLLSASVIQYPGGSREQQAKITRRALNLDQVPRGPIWSSTLILEVARYPIGIQIDCLWTWRFHKNVRKAQLPDQVQGDPPSLASCPCSGQPDTPAGRLNHSNPPYLRVAATGIERLPDSEGGENMVSVRCKIATPLRPNNNNDCKHLKRFVGLN